MTRRFFLLFSFESKKRRRLQKGEEEERRNPREERCLSSPSPASSFSFPFVLFRPSAPLCFGFDVGFDSKSSDRCTRPSRSLLLAVGRNEIPDNANHHNIEKDATSGEHSPVHPTMIGLVEPSAPLSSLHLTHHAERTTSSSSSEQLIPKEKQTGELPCRLTFARVSFGSCRNVLSGLWKFSRHSSRREVSLRVDPGHHLADEQRSQTVALARSGAVVGHGRLSFAHRPSASNHRRRGRILPLAADTRAIALVLEPAEAEQWRATTRTILLVDGARCLRPARHHA